MQQARVAAPGSHPGYLNRHPLADTRSLDEALELYAATTTGIRVESVERPAAFAWRANLALAGSLSISTHTFGCELRVAAAPGIDLFVWSAALAGHFEYIEGHESFVVGPDQASVMSSPRMSPSLRIQAGFHGVQVAIPRSSMDAALAAITGGPPQEPLRFEPRVAASAGAGASALSFVCFLMDELDRESAPLRAPIVSGRLVEAFLFGFLLGHAHNHSALLQRKPPVGGPDYVRTIEEYLEANADRPVTLADLATLTSVSVRSIQASFRAHRGCTPMEFLRARRLDLARRRLLAATGQNVAEIALQCGFEHLGRFSLAYRARFGESPKDTLRRRRGLTASAPGEGAPGSGAT